MANDQKARRVQFRLRSLLVVMTVFAAWLAWTCSRVNNQSAVVREVEQLGGTVWFADDEPKFVEFWQNPERTRSTAPPRGPAWLRRIFGDELFRDVVQIDFDRATRAPDNVEELVDRMNRLSKLETVRIGNQSFAKSCLSEFAKLRRVRNLTVNGFPVTDDELEVLGRFENLVTLCIPSGDVTDDGVAHLSNLTRLECLKLYGYEVTSKGVASITSLPLLKELILYDCNITEAELAEAAQDRPGLKAGIYYVRRSTRPSATQ